MDKRNLIIYLIPIMRLTKLADLISRVSFLPMYEGSTGARRHHSNTLRRPDYFAGEAKLTAGC